MRRSKHSRHRRHQHICGQRIPHQTCYAVAHDLHVSYIPGIRRVSYTFVASTLVFELSCPRHVSSAPHLSITSVCFDMAFTFSLQSTRIGDGGSTWVAGRWASSLGRYPRLARSLLAPRSAPSDVVVVVRRSLLLVFYRRKALETVPSSTLEPTR